MAFEYYINQGNKRLRCGYTTGSCATLASKAAFKMLLTKQKVCRESIVTPKGIPVSVDIIDIDLANDYARCSVVKDAGDDIDATDGAHIVSKVSLFASDDLCIEIDGGCGVGRVTQAGLNQDIGHAAINSTPRKMIADEISMIAEECAYKSGVKVLIEVVNGEELAKKTFNGKLGILGGISILGTSGIVEPQSLQALIDTIEVEVKSIEASGAKSILACPGNYGEKFIRNELNLKDYRILTYSNFTGNMLDFISASNIEEVLIVSHIGKGIKLAGGIMNSHSRYADCRMELFTSYAAISGVSQQSLEKLMTAKTTDACIEILEEENKKEIVMEKIIHSAQEHLSYRVSDKAKVGVLLFSNVYGILGMSDEARELLHNISQLEVER